MVQIHILQRAIEEAINRPNFTASLPPLSDITWLKILDTSFATHAENERLEFVGDALMYATLGRQMYYQIPNGTPHLYTCVRAVLHSNATFSLLAEKLDIMAVSNSVLQALTKRTFGEGKLAPNKSKPQVKATADLFETIIGAYYFDNGFEALYKWVQGVYTPLITEVANTFFRHQGGPYSTVRGPGAKKRTIDPFVYRPGALTRGPVVFRSPAPSPSPTKDRSPLHPVKQRLRVLEKIKGSRGVHSNAKMSLLGSPNVKVKVLCKKLPSTSQALTKGAATNAPAVKRPPIFIDLTGDSDTDDTAPPVRRSLVTSAIPRRISLVSKRRAPSVTSVPQPAPPRVVVDPVSHSSSESDDEIMLENMLTAGPSCSDMDVSDDERSRAHDAPLLTRTGITKTALNMAQSASHLSRSVFLR